MERTPVKSSQMVSVGYMRESDQDQAFLEVEFKNGTVYRYFDVPERTYEALLAADSVGSFFNTQVKKYYRAEKQPAEQPEGAQS